MDCVLQQKYIVKDLSFLHEPTLVVKDNFRENIFEFVFQYFSQDFVRWIAQRDMMEYQEGGIDFFGD